MIQHSLPYFDNEDMKAVSRVLKNRYVTSGPENEKLGLECAKALGRKWGIALQSGTDALILALALLKLAPGSRIAVPAYSCSAILDAAAANQLKPVPVDCSRETLAVEPATANAVEDTRATVAAYICGIPAAFENIKGTLIEDCAQLIGLEGTDRPGSKGRFAICSFYGTKLLAAGHGGLLSGNNAKDYDAAMSMLKHDKRENWKPRLHFLMSDLNAALARSQLKKLPRFIKERRTLAGKYAAALDENPPRPDRIYGRFLVKVENSLSKMTEKMNENAIEAKRPVFKPIYKYLGYPDSRFPNSAWAHDNILSVPLYPGMPDEDINKICAFLKRNKNEMRCWPPA